LCRDLGGFIGSKIKRNHYRKTQRTDGRKSTEKKTQTKEEGRRVFSEAFEEKPQPRRSIPHRPFCLNSISPLTARNFADSVNRAHYQKMSFVLLKNGKPLARLVPEDEKVCTGRDLAEALDEVELSAEEARRWRKGLAAPRRRLTPPESEWQ